MASVAPVVDDSRLLAAFYAPVHDLARLCTTSAVERNLDPRRIARGDDQWKSDCTVPEVLEKVWADLYALRCKLQNHASLRENGARSRHGDLVEGCMHFYSTLDTIVLQVRPDLARDYMHRLILMYNRLAPFNADVSNVSNVLSSDWNESRWIWRAWHQQQYRSALVQYFRAQIKDALTRPRPRLANPYILDGFSGA